MKQMAHVAVTDTFGGDANYSWVRRYNFPIRDGMSDLAIFRRAKLEAGYSGVRGQSFNHGDMMEFRPYGACIVLFVTFS